MRSMWMAWDDIVRDARKGMEGLIYDEKQCLAVNTGIDEERRVSFVNFGAIEESQEAAVAFAQPYFEVPVSRPCAAFVTSASLSRLCHAIDKGRARDAPG